MPAEERCKPWPTLPSLAAALGESMAPFYTHPTLRLPCSAFRRLVEHRHSQSVMRRRPPALGPRAGRHFCPMEGTSSFFSSLLTVREEEQTFIWAHSIHSRMQSW